MGDNETQPEQDDELTTDLEPSEEDSEQVVGGRKGGDPCEGGEAF